MLLLYFGIYLLSAKESASKRGKDEKKGTLYIFLFRSVVVLITLLV